MLKNNLNRYYFQALLRPGRLDRIVYVSLPDAETRREILQLKFNNMPIHSEVLVNWLVDKTPGYSGAEVGILKKILPIYV